MNRILIIDDHAGRSEWLAGYLRGEGSDVKIIESDIAELMQAMDGGLALAVVGLGEPLESAFYVLHEIRSRFDMPVIMIVGSKKHEDRVEALDRGADDCLPENFHPRELKARICAVLRRTKPEDTGSNSREQIPKLALGDIEVNAGMRLAYLHGKPLPLTSLEFNVLEMLLRDAGQIISREKIAQCALGRDLGTNDRSVDLHICSLRKKLGLLSNGFERIRAVRGMGYFYAVPPQGSV